MHPEKEAVLSTETAVRKPICEFTFKSDFYVYRSALFPTYISGNGIEITQPSPRSLNEWEDIHASSFLHPETDFITLSFVNHPDLNHLITSAASDSSYRIGSFVYMVSTSTPSRHTSSFTIKEIQHEDDWQNLQELSCAVNGNKSWLANSGIAMRKHIASSINCKWFAVIDPESSKFISAAGLYCNDNTVRFRRVETHPNYQRRGYATSLLRYMMQFSVKSLNAQSLVICADINGPAFKLYQNLGFKPVVETTELVKTKA